MQGLIAMRKAGVLLTIQAHGNRIQVEMSADPGQLRPINWQLAAAMVDRHRANRKAKAAVCK